MCGGRGWRCFGAVLQLFRGWRRCLSSGSSQGQTLQAATFFVRRVWKAGPAVGYLSAGGGDVAVAGRRRKNGWEWCGGGGVRSWAGVASAAACYLLAIPGSLARAFQNRRSSRKGSARSGPTKACLSPCQSRASTSHRTILFTTPFLPASFFPLVFSGTCYCTFTRRRDRRECLLYLQAITCSDGPLNLRCPCRSQAASVAGATQESSTAASRFFSPKSA